MTRALDGPRAIWCDRLLKTFRTGVDTRARSPAARRISIPDRPAGTDPPDSRPVAAEVAAGSSTTTAESNLRYPPDNPAAPISSPTSVSRPRYPRDVGAMWFGLDHACAQSES